MNQDFWNYEIPEILIHQILEVARIILDYLKSDYWIRNSMACLGANLDTIALVMWWFSRSVGREKPCTSSQIGNGTAFIANFSSRKL